MLAGCLKLLLAESVTEVILTWVSHAAVQPTINQSRHGCKPKPENFRSNSKSLPTLATIVVENYAAVAAYLNNGLHTEPFLGRVSMLSFLYGPGEPGRYPTKEARLHVIQSN